MVSGHPRVEQAQGNWGPGMTSGPAQALPGFPACCSGLGSIIIPVYPYLLLSAHTLSRREQLPFHPSHATINPLYLLTHSGSQTVIPLYDFPSFS